MIQVLKKIGRALILAGLIAFGLEHKKKKARASNIVFL